MIDTVLTPFLAGLGGLVLLVATYYVNRFLRRRAARDVIEEAITTSVAITSDTTMAMADVQMAAPEALRTLGIKPAELKARIEQRIVNSRGIVI